MKNEYHIEIKTHNSEINLNSVEMVITIEPEKLKDIITELSRSFREATITDNETGEIIYSSYRCAEVFESWLGEKWGISEILCHIWGD